MKTIFRIGQHDTVIACLFNSNYKVIATIYDSGFTTIGQVKSALLIKVNDYDKKGSYNYSIVNKNKGTYWTNR